MYSSILRFFCKKVLIDENEWQVHPVVLCCMGDYHNSKFDLRFSIVPHKCTIHRLEEF